MYALQNDLNHCLSTENLKKVKIVSKLSEILILKVIRISCNALFGIVFGFYCIIAYVKQDYEYSLILLLIWFLILMLWVLNITAILSFSYSILFFAVYYMKLRFKQLITCKILTYRISHLNDLMRAHNSLTIMTNNYNKFFNYLMATNHYITTIEFNLLVFITVYGNGNIYFRLANAVLAVFTVILMNLVAYTSSNLSKEAHRLYFTINSLNVSRKLTLNLKWKVRYIFDENFFNSFLFLK